MKKIVLSILLALVLMSPIVSTVFAAEGGNGPINEHTLPSDVIVERYDVPLNIAINDKTFSAMANLQSSLVINKSGSKTVTWNVWGNKEWNPSTYLYYPVGYSEHKDGGTVLPTFHYTRTFLGPKWTKRGDSGRWWGFYTVRASGTDCTQDEWDVFTHRVFYGTTSD